MALRMDRTDRRWMLQAMAMSAAWWSVPGAFAQQLVPTAPQTEGPFYPDHLPLDTDNDLIVINDAVTPAVGAVTLLSGRILTASGQPVRNALVEIWQVDNNGVYIHSGSNDRKKHDTNFQGFGRFLTGSSGEYLFRTIKPVPYPGRTPHIHFAIKTKGREKFTTQCYIQGEPQNERDGVLRAVKDPKAKATLMVAFTPMPGSTIGELTAKFDVVLGFTPNV
jgi:protocatechuate 3,4-dioxygenase, beta subunit